MADEDVKIVVGIEGEEEVKKGLEGIGESAEEVGETSEDSFGKMQKAMEKAIISVNLKKKAMDFLINSAKKMADEFIQFEKALSKANTHLNLGRKELIEYGKQLEDIGIKTATSSLEMAEAFETTLSSGVALTDSMEFLEVASKFAQASFTDVTSSVDILTTAINAYGMETEDAGKIADIFVRTQQLGKVSTDNLASSFSTIAGVSADFGISIEQVAGGLASMTSMGSSVAESLVQQRQLFSELSKQSTEVGKTFTSIAGKTFPEFISEGNDVSDALELLGKYADQTDQSMFDLFSSVQAGSGALTLGGRNLDKFRKNVDEVSKSAGTMETAYSVATDNMKDNFERLGQLIKSDFTPIIASIVEEVNRLLKLYLDWRERIDSVNDSNRVGMKLIQQGIDLHKLQNDVAEKGKELGLDEQQITLYTTTLRKKLSEEIEAGAEAQEAYNRLLKEMFEVEEKGSTGGSTGDSTGGSGSGSGSDGGLLLTDKEKKDLELEELNAHNLAKLEKEQEFYRQLVEIKEQNFEKEDELILQHRLEQIQSDIDFFEKKKEIQGENFQYEEELYNARLSLYKTFTKEFDNLETQEEKNKKKHLENRKKIDEYSVAVSNATYKALVDGRINSLGDFINVMASELTAIYGSKAVEHTAYGMSDLALAGTYLARGNVGMQTLALDSAKTNFATATKFGVGAGAMGGIAGLTGGIGGTNDNNSNSDTESPIGGDDSVTDDIIDESNNTSNRTVIVQGVDWLLEMINKESIDKYNKAIIE